MFQAVSLCKTYHRQPVLRDVSFCLGPGHCLGVVGENGTGKSTLLSILAQVRRPDSGDLRFQGRSVLGDREFMRRCVGYVPQGCDLMPELTAAQQLKLWQTACQCSAPLSPELAHMLGLSQLWNVRIGEMSGGMQRRVSIAMALSTDPPILILDEVTAGLDREFREALLCYLESYLARGGRIVWCSHLPEENQRLCGAFLPL